MNKFQQDIEKIIKDLPNFLQNKADFLPFQFQALIASEMDLANPSQDWIKGNTNISFPQKESNFTNKNKLQSRTGQLIQSYLPKSKHTATKINVNNFVMNAELGTNLPYAKIHETGGFIRHKGKMPKWFWWKFKQTGNQFFKIMALSSQQKGGVMIPKRETFNPAWKSLQENEFERWLKQIFSDLGDKYSAS